MCPLTSRVPLHAEAVKALRGYAARPAASTDALLVSLRTRKSALPEPISAGAVGDLVAAAAGHVDIRTTQIYVYVTDQRKVAGIVALERALHPLAA